MKKSISVSLDGEAIPARDVVLRLIEVGMDKENIRKACIALEITNFSQAWKVAQDRLGASK